MKVLVRSRASFWFANEQLANQKLYRFLQHHTPCMGDEWMIAGDESNNTDILLVKMFAEHLKTAYR